MKVLSFGEILFDVIEGEHYLGGAPLNFAAHLAQCGAEAYILSKVGADELGTAALEQVRNLGVMTDFVDVDTTHATGTVEVVLTNGQPDYTIHEDVAYDYISFEDRAATLENLEFDLLYFGTLAQRSEPSREALRQLVELKKFGEVYYDVNLRKGFYTKDILNDSLGHCTILKLNDEEVMVLSELLFGEELSIADFCSKAAAAYDIRTVVITAGAAGCYVCDDGILNFVKGHTVEVADTVGAGDAFSAAFVFKHLSGENALDAAKAANRLGAYVASSRGPIPAYTPKLRIELGLEPWEALS